ncbi:MAG: cyclase [Gemmatimonadetes bacterium]|nr:cyclase [Gemmatimonadota bacterium]
MRLIDLSKPIHVGMSVYPGDPEVEINVVQTREAGGWEFRSLSMGSHTGTHVDAVSHVKKGGPTLSDLPLEQFYGPVVCPSDSATLPEGIGLIYKRHLEISQMKEILQAKPPFVGGPSLDADLERRLLNSGIVTYDGLVNLESLPEGVPFTFSGLPLPIQDGDGSPVRAIAILAK